MTYRTQNGTLRLVGGLLGRGSAAASITPAERCAASELTAVGKLAEGSEPPSRGLGRQKLTEVLSTLEVPPESAVASRGAREVWSAPLPPAQRPKPVHVGSEEEGQVRP
jgi:hypothetical protein